MREILTILAGVSMSGIDNNIPKTDADVVMNNILNVAFWGLGVTGVVMLIFGGIQFMTSQGDTAKAQKARMTILYSVIGIIVVIAAGAITNFVLGAIG